MVAWKVVERILGIHQAQIQTNMNLARILVGLPIHLHVAVLRNSVKRFLRSRAKPLQDPARL
ncbi:hypothetical protein J3U87_21555 [Sulfidibacter corallicola]|uniref:Transposase n=1 Tax=Sulfidibacter corallicola TaxID=2818388 RepID=A0A8A4TYL1_SULCO|nr:hypothetical protein J3U87_21555 [Sulfidibacter corallicola]